MNIYLDQKNQENLLFYYMITEPTVKHWGWVVFPHDHHNFYVAKGKWNNYWQVEIWTFEWFHSTEK